MSENTFLLLCSLLFLFSCKTPQKTGLNLKQDISSEKIIAKFDKFKNIKLLNIPIEVTLKNESTEDFDLTSYHYIYSGFNKNKGNKPLVYFINEQKKEKFNHSKINTIKKGKNYSFLIITQHFVDSVKFPKSYFFEDSSILKPSKNNSFSLNLGDFKNFKKNYSDLYKFLIQSDSLIFKFHNKPRITIPVE